MKKVFKIMFFVSLALLLIFAAVSVISFFSFENNSKSVGIIGGADGPTAIMLTGTLFFHTSVFQVIPFVFVFFVISVVGLLITRKK